MAEETPVSSGRTQMPAPVHMQSLAAAFAQVLGEMHPGYAWDVEVDEGYRDDRPHPSTAPAPARELPWPDAPIEAA